MFTVKPWGPSLHTHQVVMVRFWVPLIKAVSFPQIWKHICVLHGCGPCSECPGSGHLLCLWAGCTLWSCLKVWGVQGLFLSHSNADLLSVALPVCLHPSSFLWGVLSVFCSCSPLRDVFMGLSHLSGAVFQLNTRLFPPSMQVSFYKKTHKIFSFPWTLFFVFLGSLPSLHVHLCEPCLSWLLWSTGSEAITTSWSKNGLGRVVAYTGGLLLFCASGAGE